MESFSSQAISLLIEVLSPLAVPYFISLLLWKRPPPLPKELHEWEGLKTEEEVTTAWHHYASLLESQGLKLYGTKSYIDLSTTDLPAKPAENPFNPQWNEDFLHRVVGPARPELHWTYVHPVLFPALDRFGHQVLVKAAPLASEEWQIVRHLSSSRPQTGENHTIPIIGIVPAGDWAFIVQATWGEDWFSPPLSCIKDRIEVARQLAEGIAFMHAQGVTHGDIHRENVVWNHSNLRDPRRPSLPNRRVFPCRYAFIDFGSSTMLKSCVTNLQRPYPPSCYKLPEKNEASESYDPYPADVYMLGKLLLEVEEEFCPSSGSSSYKGLLASMVAVEPATRPTAKQIPAILETATLDCICELCDGSGK